MLCHPVLHAQEKAKAEQRVTAAMMDVGRGLNTRKMLEPQPDATASAAAAGLLSSDVGPLKAAEPLLDEAFYNTVSSHFNNLAASQTQQLQHKLNNNLPAILEQFGVSLPDKKQ